MASTQLQSISELLSYPNKQSTKNKSENSLKYVPDSNRSEKSATKKKKKLRKTRNTLRKKQLGSDNDSSTSGNEMPAIERRKKRKRRSKKRSSESVVESLAVVGREYGNNVSKRNISKVVERPQTIHKLSHGVSSKTATSREYGDFFSWKSGLTYLETHRIDQIQSKGIKRFADEYLKKLQRCEEFENGHNVQPFASARLQLLTGVGKKSNMSQDSEIDKDVRLSDVQNIDEDADKIDEPTQPALNTETQNISVAALRTIGLIKKFQNGESIEADLHVIKKNVGSAVDTTKDNRVRGGRFVSKRNIPNTKEDITAADKKSSIKETEKANDGKKIDTGTMALAQKSTTEKYDIKINKSLEKFLASPDSQKREMERLPSIEETPSEGTIDLSLGQKPTEDFFELPKQKSGSSERVIPSGAGGYVLMKKVLTSTENTVTIVGGKKRYDLKNRSVERHYAGKVPMSRTSSVDKNRNVSVETLYQTLRDKRVEGSVDQRVK